MRNKTGHCKPDGNEVSMSRALFSDEIASSNVRPDLPVIEQVQTMEEHRIARSKNSLEGENEIKIKNVLEGMSGI